MHPLVSTKDIDRGEIGNLLQLISHMLIRRTRKLVNHKDQRRFTHEGSGWVAEDQDSRGLDGRAWVQVSPKISQGDKAGRNCRSE
jgi:hypothetical protein